jgi:hypothetical protein
VPEQWISVKNWSRFQRYDPSVRNLPWIKNYTSLLHDPDYMDLSEHRALLLHRLWLVYAASRSRVAADSLTSLSRSLGVRVTRSDLEALTEAGFIEIVAQSSHTERTHAAHVDLDLDKEKGLKDKRNSGPRRSPRADPTPKAPPKPSPNGTPTTLAQDWLERYGRLFSTQDAKAILEDNFHVKGAELKKLLTTHEALLKDIEL